MKTVKITVPDVLKKDLRIVGFLLLNGGVAYLSQTVLKDNTALALVFGASANYIAYRLMEELKGEGYKKALEK